MEFDHEFDQHITSFVAASDRVRFTLVVVVLASVIVFAGIWNSSQQGWQLSRLMLTRAALQHQLWKGLPPQFESAKQEDLLRRAKNFIDRRRLNTPEMVRDMHTALQAHVINHVATIQIPFLGITIDVNDLGIVGGFGFAVIMLWYTFSLYRLKWNMELSLERFRTLETIEARRIAYNAFVMRQVLNTPPSIHHPKPNPWRHAPRSLCLSPLAVHLYVMVYDYKTYEAARSISALQAKVQLITEWVWLIPILILTFLSLWTSYKIDRLWSNAFSELKAGDIPRKEQEGIPSIAAPSAEPSSTI